VRLSRLIELLETALGKKAVVNRLSPQPGDVPLTCADVSKARGRLGYSPQVKVEQGIPRFVDWFRQDAAASGEEGNR
jgi:UDP-glucuronate 4-epimerase